MSAKTDAKVLIDGKVFTISGYESEEYIQRVASYINNKLEEFNQSEQFKRQPVDIQNVLIQINLADDYFKARKENEMLEEDIQTKEKEIYDLKHELIAAQMKMENMEKSTKNLQSELNENTKKVVRLETELKDLKKA